MNGQYRLANGFRAPDGTIYVNINSENPLMVTFGHEMFHDLVSTGKYGGMIDTLVQSPEYAATIKVELDHKAELYKVNGIDLSADEVAEEVAADICGTILASDSILEYIGARNAESATGIKGFLNRILNKLKGKPSAQEAYDLLSESQRALIDGMEGRAEASVNSAGEFSLIGIAPDGMEIYETSISTQQLSEAQKKKQYLDLIKNQYRGRTARLERNGHAVYVKPDIQEARKPVYGDRRSTINGAKALLNSLADGDVFDLLENAKYNRSSKDSKNHNNADYFDYYVKTVQIDGKVYDLLADVKRAYGNSDGLYYTLHLVDNTTKKAVVSQRPQTLGSFEPITASSMGSNSFSADSLPQTEPAVNSYSMQNSAEDAQGKHSLMELPATDSTGRELSESQRALIDGMEGREEDSVTSAEKLSLVVDRNGKRYVQSDRIVIDENSNLSPAEQVEYYIAEVIANGVGVRIPTVEGDIITIDPRTAHKVVDKGYTSHGKRFWLNKADYSVKLEAAAHIDELISSSVEQHHGSAKGNTKDRTNKDVKASDGWKYRTAYFKSSNGYTYKINISIAQDGEIELAYSIGKPENKKRTADGNALSGGDMGSKATSAVLNNNIPQTEPAVNSYSMQNSAEDIQGKHSLMELPATDSTGRELSAEQQEYFKDSKVRNDSGELKPVYHGSPNIFTEFSADFMSMYGSSEGQGFYFTDYKPIAEGYQKNNGQLLEGYLDIQKPLSDSAVTLTKQEVKKLLQSVDPTGDEVLVNYDPAGGIGYPSKAWYNRALDATVKVAMDYNESDSEILAEIANGGAGSGAVMEAARNVLGYDGYIVEGKYDGATVYVAFDSSQFKNVDNLTPTSSKDIRYSLMQTKSGESFVMVENAMTNAQLNDPKVIADYIASHIGEMYTIIESGQKVYIGKDLPNEYTRSKYSQSIIQGGKKKAKNKAVSNLGEMVEIATNRRWEKPRHSQNKDAAYGIYRYDTTFAFPVKGTPDTYRAYDAELIIRNASDGKKYLYDIVGIKENTGLVLDLNQKARGRQYAAAQSSASNNKLPQTEAVVNSYSMQEPEIDAPDKLSLMDTLPQEKYLADLEQSKEEAELTRVEKEISDEETARINETAAELSAEGAEASEFVKAVDTVADLKKQLSDLRKQTQKEAKQNAKWYEAEAKLIAEIAAAKEKEKAAQQKIAYDDKLAALAERYRNQKLKERIRRANSADRKKLYSLLNRANSLAKKSSPDNKNALRGGDTTTTQDKAIAISEQDWTPQQKEAAWEAVRGTSKKSLDAQLVTYRARGDNTSLSQAELYTYLKGSDITDKHAIWAELFPNAKLTYAEYAKKHG